MSSDIRSEVLELGRRYASAERAGDAGGMAAAEQELGRIDGEMPFDADLRAVFDEGRRSAGV
jgi:hypothetical protein